MFQTLTDVLHKIDPVHLNATLTALGEGLRGNGDDLGATMAGLNTYLGADQSEVADAAVRSPADRHRGQYLRRCRPDLVTVLDNAPTISNTIVDQQDNLNATLLAATGLANNGYETLAPAAEDYIAAIQRARAPAEGARRLLARISAAC